MGPAAAAGQPKDSAPGFGVPIGSAQPHKSRDHIHALAVPGERGDLFALRGRADQLHGVPQPLDRAAGHEDAALQGVFYLAVITPGNGCHQPETGADRFFPGIHQKETAGAVCVFDHARFKARLSEQRGLLVPGDTGYGNLPAMKVIGSRVSVNERRGLNLRKHGGRHL